MEKEKERVVLLAVFDILYEREFVTKEEYHRLKVLVHTEEIGQ